MDHVQDGLWHPWTNRSHMHSPGTALGREFVGREAVVCWGLKAIVKRSCRTRQTGEMPVSLQKNLQTLPDFMKYRNFSFAYMHTEAVTTPFFFHNRIKDLDIWEWRKREGEREERKKKSKVKNNHLPSISPM